MKLTYYNYIDRILIELIRTGVLLSFPSLQDQLAKGLRPILIADVESDMRKAKALNGPW